MVSTEKTSGFAPFHGKAAVSEIPAQKLPEQFSRPLCGFSVEQCPKGNLFVWGVGEIVASATRHPGGWVAFVRDERIANVTRDFAFGFIFSRLIGPKGGAL